MNVQSPPPAPGFASCLVRWLSLAWVFRNLQGGPPAPTSTVLTMMPEKKHYSYTNLADTPQHGEIIESSYLLGEKGPKSTWTKVLEMAVLLATVGGCAYLFLFLFHHGNHHPVPAKHSASPPHPPVGASSSNSHLAACCNNPGCAKLDLGGACCPNGEGDTLECCYDN